MKNTNRINYFHKMPPKGISWKAIIAGTVATLGAMLILNLIGLALGLWSIEPTEENNPLSGLGTGAVIWWVVSNLIVLFIGGFVAGRVGVSFTNTSGIIHGIMTWALYALISAWLLTSVIGSILSGVGNAVGEVLSTAGEAMQDQLAPVVKEQFEGIEISLDDARKQIYSLLEDTDKEALDPENLEVKAAKSAADAKEGVKGMSDQPESADADIERIFSKSKNRFEQSFEAIDKEALVNVLVKRTDMNQSEAKRTVDNTLAEFERAREELNDFLEKAEAQALEKAEKTAKAVGDAAMYLAIALILGIIASAFGGFVGVKNLRDDCIRNDYLTDTSDTEFGRGEL